MTALRLTAALVLCALPARALCANCPIDGVDLFKFTKSQGYLSHAQPTKDTPAASCTEAWPAVTVSAPADKPGSCRLDLFQGAALATGWKFKQYKLVGVAEPSNIVGGEGSRLAMSLQASAKAGESVNISLSQVVLTGPHCDQWMDAIVAAPADHQ
jgi:hypothetical protein